MRFRDRTEAGHRLAEILMAYTNRPNIIVLGLPRGGVPVAFVVAQTLHVPLDVMIVRKLGVPGEEELAMGAVSSGDVRVLNEDVIRLSGVSQHAVDAATVREQREVARRERIYRNDQPLPNLRQRIVILVDDGIATGATMRAAIAAVRSQQPARIVVAVPVAAAETCEALRGEVEELACVLEPDVFFGVGFWYQDFPQITDEEVRALLARAWEAEAQQHQ